MHFDRRATCLQAMKPMMDIFVVAACGFAVGVVEIWARMRVVEVMH